MTDSITIATPSAPCCNREHTDTNLHHLASLTGLNVENIFMVKFLPKQAYKFGEYKYITKEPATISITTTQMS
jgi:hypothetical protein